MSPRPEMRIIRPAASCKMRKSGKSVSTATGRELALTYCLTRLTVMIVDKSGWIVTMRFELIFLQANSINVGCQGEGG